MWLTKYLKFSTLWILGRIFVKSFQNWLTCSLETGDGGIIITSLGFEEVDSRLSRSILWMDEVSLPVPESVFPVSEVVDSIIMSPPEVSLGFSALFTSMICRLFHFICHWRECLLLFSSNYSNVDCLQLKIDKNFVKTPQNGRNLFWYVDDGNAVTFHIWNGFNKVVLTCRSNREFIVFTRVSLTLWNVEKGVSAKFRKNFFIAEWNLSLRKKCLKICKNSWWAYICNV